MSQQQTLDNQRVRPPIRHIGLLGGTFDPPHHGHLLPLQEILAQLPLDSIWLLPNHIPPHKAGTHASAGQRLDMVSLLCGDNTRLSPCTIELERTSPSYTVDTLERLRHKHPDCRFYFIMGMDSFLSLPQWHRWQSLFDLCHLILCERPGWQLDEAQPMMAQLQARGQKAEAGLPQADCGAVIEVPITEQSWSSTEIRAALRHGELPDGAMPKAVGDYIRHHRLYRHR
ncbi:nicotinate-nucleotide adenylyltransferase [Shewanella sedimentimangrovi]|uniref:Probable nicotinate-nucleotide adenylyltransferase n=1 Tax=Shewanella sedimentimangrovi TaxID=2814293 RepID=A0ABX7QXS5_9GAMM|nr:nicotinate-nucleotide adenylyltransferase [Shewanella sedimentimangrovi]QSX36329.1 nicotinate-nucleotide adenylyltransferase [Shewanella sedimentimangrovi]